MSETKQTSPPRKGSGMVKPIGIGCGAILLLFIIIVIAVGPDVEHEMPEPGGDSETVVPSPSALPGMEPPVETNQRPHSRLLRKADFSEKWPLAVEQGIVECRDGMAVLFHANGKTYPVNGTAKGWYRDLPKIEEIWLEDTTRPGLRIDITPILDAGRNLCE